MTTSMPNAYSETRQHELRKTRLMMIDGNLSLNSRTAEGGVSARAYHDGYWGFASAPQGADSAQKVIAKAQANALTMARFGKQATLSLPRLASSNHRDGDTTRV